MVAIAKIPWILILRHPARDVPLSKRKGTPEGVPFHKNEPESYALNELPQPQVDFTFGLLNLNPEPSMLST